MEPLPITSQKHDPAWKHCQMFKIGDRIQLKCLYCSKLFRGGGIHRIKEHLAGKKGNASTFLGVSHDVHGLMQQSLDGVVVKKRNRQKLDDEITSIVAPRVDRGGEVDMLELVGVDVEPVERVLVNRDRKKRGRGRSSSSSHGDRGECDNGVLAVRSVTKSDSFQESTWHKFEKNNGEDCMDPISCDSISLVEDWVTGNDVCLKDLEGSSWTTLESPSASTMILDPSSDDTDDFGSGFYDDEIFSRRKHGEITVVEDNVEHH